MADATLTVPVTAKPDPKKAKKPDHPRDPAREVIETIVFVVVLVLLLKLFVVEAFVIPTGSMAETLYGYQKIATCPECGYEFPVNSHDEVEPNPQTGRRHTLLGCTCPNCRYPVSWPKGIGSPPNRSGDRVLVLKPIYHATGPQRGDVVVFKYPEAPQDKQTAQNYIKRAMAFGGETVAIHRGELFTNTGVQYPADVPDDIGGLRYPRPADPKNFWKPEFMYYSAPPAMEVFEKTWKAGFPAGADFFQIVRKTDDQVLACRRVVWDNDHQPKDQVGKLPPRWYSEQSGRWAGDSPTAPKAFTLSGGELSWLRYRNLVWDRLGEAGQVAESKITNFTGYNSPREEDFGTRGDTGSQWVGDLLVECEAELGSADAELVLELSKGVNRFQAKFAGGQVTISRTGPGAKDLATRPTKLTGPGKHRVLFANVDCRLRVWVDGAAIDFGPDASYPPAVSDQFDPRDTYHEGWTTENDVKAPAGVGAKGQVTVRGLKLWRDIFYTRSDMSSDASKPETFYIQPGHYMCLGDNSAQSSDSRKWGTVPERLLLGKAVFVFFPVPRIGFIK